MKPLENTTKTVLVLLAIILLSGLLIPKAYFKYVSSREFRPPFEKGLTKNIELLDDQKGVISLSEFQGQIWIAYCTASAIPNTLAQEKIKSLRASFPAIQLKTCAFLVDATETEGEKLKAYRTAHAATLTDSDRIVAANITVIQKYLKNEFRFALLPHLKDSVWTYDSDLILLDQIPEENKGLPQAALCHMRGHFNFEKATALDQALTDDGKAPIYMNRLTQVLIDSVAYLLENPNEEDPALIGEQKK